MMRPWAAIAVGLLLSLGVTAQARAEETDYKSPAEYREIVDGMSDDELSELMAITWLEARGESFEGQRAVVEAVFNRVLSRDFPDNVHDVLSQKGQFSTWKNRSKAKPDEVQADAILAVYEEEPVLPSTAYVYFSTGRQSYGHDYVKIMHHWFGR